MKHNRNLFDANASKRINRNLLPETTTFYSKEFPTIKIKSSWTKVHCCFHDDTHPSLNINLISGGFYCFACNTKGGDVIAFVMKRYQLTFNSACRYLGLFL